MDSLYFMWYHLNWFNFNLFNLISQRGMWTNHIAKWTRAKVRILFQVHSHLTSTAHACMHNTKRFPSWSHPSNLQYIMSHRQAQRLGKGFELGWCVPMWGKKMGTHHLNYWVCWAPYGAMRCMSFIGLDIGRMCRAGGQAGSRTGIHPGDKVILTTPWLPPLMLFPMFGQKRLLRTDGCIRTSKSKPIHLNGSPRGRTIVQLALAIVL
jgi:hypothetical protein